MEFCLLGPLLVRCDGVQVPVPSGKQRAVLAALLLKAGRVVSLDQLAEVLWGSAPPRSARVTVQNYVKRLRQTLADSGKSRIATRPDGYVISVQPDELDVTRFEAFASAARAATRQGSWEDAARQARAALALWRGEPLEDAASEALAVREAPRLAEMRLQALEARIEADLHLGRAADVVAELRADWRPSAAGAPAAAADAGFYRTAARARRWPLTRNARRLLIEELGTEPGTELRELHQRILAGDPGSLPQRPSRSPAGAVPRSCRAAAAPPSAFRRPGRRAGGAGRGCWTWPERRCRERW